MKALKFFKKSPFFLFLFVFLFGALISFIFSWYFLFPLKFQKEKLSPSLSLPKEVPQGKTYFSPSKVYPKYIKLKSKNEKEIEININKEGFFPKGFQVKTKDKVTFLLKNQDKKPHSFVIKELNLNLSLKEGETKKISLPSPLKEGIYTFYSHLDKENENFKGIMMVLE